MRTLLLTLASLAAAGTAGASSLENVIPGSNANSVSQFSCTHCPPLVVKKTSNYIVPEVAPGTERVERKEINGEMKLVRTEAWLGGSPVVFISKAPEEPVKAAQVEPEPQQLPGMTSVVDSVPADAPAAAIAVIDTTAKTGAVTTASMAEIGAVTPQNSHSQEVDLENFQLRLK
ncbi:hypothetical protein ADU59_24280 [Pararhizobium polonicum]|uniref:Uncharacterized protein n=1 Tax=Pararhizobium polonicum TaxID=1612624 RepID=A0A1C7NVC7_9HYPH|nr:plant virulence effector HPE1-like domain-containing protein [Pararhizobium polonicum]OBZ92961.1 hypothetical protein ADU59_24280 [Pararhizobium polonicum]